MNREQFEAAMRSALIKAGKSTDVIDDVVYAMLNMPFMQTDEARLACFNEWSDKV